MRKLFAVILLLSALGMHGQSWQNKNAIRVIASGNNLKISFSDSSFAYVQKSSVLYIVDLPGIYVLLGYRYAGNISCIISFPYTSITLPTSTSSKDLSSKLNALLQ